MKNNEVTAIITAMTDSERPFLAECIASALSDPAIVRAIVCIQDSNTWIDEVRKSVPTDERVLVLRLPLTAVGCVRNEAVKHVKTEWIAFCDGDDVWCKDKASIQRTYALEHNADFVASDHYLTDEAGRVCAVALAMYLPMTSAWMVRTSVMQQHPFKEDKKFNGTEDHEWWFDTKKTVKKDRCAKLLLRYRVRGSSLSSAEPSKARKARVVAWGSLPVIRWGVLMLTSCLWLINRSGSYRPLLK